MKTSVILVWVNKAFEYLVSKFLETRFPGLKNVFARLDDVLDLAVDVVTAAEASGADGVAKKAQASKDLMEKLKTAGIDIPGDQDQAICDMIVEAVVAGVKKFFKLT